MIETASQRRTGIVLILAAAVAWSTAPFFTRLLALLDSWTILFWRGLSGAAVITVVLVLTRGRAGLRDFTGMGKSGWLVAGLSTLGMISFIPSLQLTSVSNVAIIIATGPFVAAALAWIWLREIPALRTVLASFVALCGAIIIVGNTSGSADVLGIALACFMTFVIAAMTVAVRRHKDTPMVAAAALSNLLGSIVSIPFAHGIESVSATNLVTLALFGFLQVGLGLSLFMLGSRLLP
jgi:drug/metabolite transporter (DMT)-like permease